MNNYFKNYLLVFFSFFVMPVFAMEIKNTISGKEIAAELIALTNLPQEKKINKNDLFLEQDRRDAENWFNKGNESIQEPKDSEEILLNYFVKRGTNVPDADKFDSYFFAVTSQQNSLQFNFIQNTIKKEPSKREQPHKLPYIKKAPLTISDLPSPIDGRKKSEKINKKQNCLLM